MRGGSQPDQSILIREIISAATFRRERASSLPLHRTLVRLTPFPLGGDIEHLCAPGEVGPLVGTRTAVEFACAPPTCREVALFFLSVLAHQSPVVLPAHSSCRITSLATISREPPSPPPTSATPVAPMPPSNVSRSVLASFMPPRPLLPLFPSMTPPPRYVLLTPTAAVVGPPPAPRLSSQSALRLPAPGNHAFTSPSTFMRVPTSIDRQSLDIGRLPRFPLDLLTVSLHRLFL